jgi:protein-arginine kinase activator protein McsA
MTTNNDSIGSKICTRCKGELPATTEFFHAQKQGRNNLRSVCKACRSVENKITGSERYARLKAKRMSSLPKIQCESCNQTFQPHRSEQRFCSHKCSMHLEKMILASQSVEAKRKAILGRQKHPSTGKFTTNIHAKGYSLRSPFGCVFNGVNLGCFVRENEGMFNGEGELLIRKQLSRLRPWIATPIPSWKGWTWEVEK